MIYKPTYISTVATTTVSTKPAVIHSIVLGETAAGAITIKDGATDIAVLKASIAEGTYIFDAECRTSLVIVTAGASKLTAMWQPIG